MEPFYLKAYAQQVTSALVANLLLVHREFLTLISNLIFLPTQDLVPQVTTAQLDLVTQSHAQRVLTSQRQEQVRVFLAQHSTTALHLARPLRQVSVMLVMSA